MFLENFYMSTDRMGGVVYLAHRVKILLNKLTSGLNKILNRSNFAQKNNTEKSGYLIEVSGFHC
jgi:hypothetical protein